MSKRTISRTIRLAIASTAAALVLGAAAETAVIASSPAHAPATTQTAMILRNNPWPGPAPAPVG